MTVLDPPARRVWPLLIPFFFSGAAALVAQLAWLRILTVSLGGSSTALNIVLVTFMGGLAVGSALAKRVCRYTDQYILLYAVLETVLFGYVLISAPLIRGISNGLSAVLPSVGHESLLENLIRLVVCGATLLLPTVVMGMTTPVLITASVRRFRDTATRAGLLYGINTFGAAAGALLAGCYLILKIGVSRTLTVAAGLNLLAAVIALGLVMLRRASEAESPSTAGMTGSASQPTPLDASAADAVRRLGLLAFAGGFCGMALEVIFARFLTFVIGSSYYSHTISIGGFLLGIVAGSLTVGGIARWRQPSASGLPRLLFSFGVAALLASVLFEHVPGLLQRLVIQQRIIEMHFFTLKLTAAFALVLLPAMVSGMLLPYLMHLVTQRIGDVTRGSANVLLLNTVGSVLGVLVTGYGLIAWLGVRHALFVITATLFGLALYAGTTRDASEVEPQPGRGRWAYGVAGLVALLAFVAWRGGEPLILRSVIYDQLGRPDVLYYEEDESASVSVVQYNDRNARGMLINGLIAGEVDRDSIVEGVIADVAMLSHPDPKSLFLAGVGTGRTAGVAGLYSGVETRAVEISGAVISALPYFEDYTFNVTENPQVTIVHGDARHYLQRTTERFDVIGPDVYLSAITGTAYLYNQEFFELCAKRLKPQGRVVLNIYLTTAIDRVIATSFVRAFPEVELIALPYNNYNFLIGSNDPIRFSSQPWERWADHAGVQQRLEQLGVTQGDGLGSLHVASRKHLLQELQGVTPSTDDHPIVDFIRLGSRFGALTF